MKECKECKEVKSFDKFWKMSKSKDGYQYSCKSCCLKLRKKYATPDYKKQKYLEYTYGLTKEELQLMYARQDYRCDICHIHTDNTPRGLFVDHCHDSNEVRALLCLNCNTAIGHFKDNPELMERGAEYVRRFQHHKKSWKTKEGEAPSGSAQGPRGGNEGLSDEDVKLSKIAKGP